MLTDQPGWFDFDVDKWIIGQDLSSQPTHDIQLQTGQWSFPPGEDSLQPTQPAHSPLLQPDSAKERSTPNQALQPGSGMSTHQSDLHINQILEKVLADHYSHAFIAPGSEEKDVATQWHEIDCRYQEFIKFFKQYEYDRKRVSYD